MLSDEQYLRYAAQIATATVGEHGQQALARAQVTVVGLGGLGCAAAHYLAGAGIGRLTLLDADVVQLSNLQRQTLYSTADVGHTKADCAAKRLAAVNPTISLQAMQQRVTAANVCQLLSGSDLVLDCTDNLASRYLINDQCYALGIPLLSAAAEGMNGQLLCLHPQHAHGCYQCLYPSGVQQSAACERVGVVGAVVGMMGTLQALQAVKVLTGTEVEWGKLFLFDGLNLSWQSLNLPCSVQCPRCGGNDGN